MFIKDDRELEGNDNRPDELTSCSGQAPATGYSYVKLRPPKNNRVWHN